jgi:hypothetical protein
MINKYYYRLKPVIPRSVQIFIRRNIVRIRRKKYLDIWPIDVHAATPPSGWSGWPEGKRFALILTHDVDTGKGAERCHALANLEESLGFRSSFNFVPERYKVLPEWRNYLMDRGFEVGVHGLYHDGKYFYSKEIFHERVIKINRYLKEWNAVGYRSPSMLRKLDWFCALDILYDASTFDTDPFEPQPDGVRTIFPFSVHGEKPEQGFVELPYTLPQDFTLFILMKEKNIEIWKKKLDWIERKGGMALLNTHPDYMNFGDKKMGMEECPIGYYEEFLNYVKNTYGQEYWHVLPKEMAFWWKTRE